MGSQHNISAKPRPFGRGSTAMEISKTTKTCFSANKTGFSIFLLLLVN